MLIDGFVTCPRGLEDALADELTELGVPEVAVGLGGVRIVGERRDLYRVNLQSRLAGRVLRRVGEVKARDAEALYRSVHAIDWPAEFAVGRRFRIRFTARKSPLRSLQFATLKAKDAVCDRFRADTGRRPDVDPKGAEVSIHVFVDGRRGWAYLDTSGAPLFQRGWRRGEVAAPLRENLAAGLLALSGWRADANLADPFCGGGTLLIEAARQRAGLPPALPRDYAFQALADYDPEGWQRLLAEAREGRRETADLPPLCGLDIDGKALSAARRNAESADVADQIVFEKGDARDWRPAAASGWLVTNPPYGERLEAGRDLSDLYRAVGEQWQRHWADWTLAVLSPEKRLGSKLGMGIAAEWPLYNGDIACWLRQMAPTG